MSGTEDTTVRVINEEYERVLSNPDNLIMSDELQSLIDLNLEDRDASDQPLPIDPLVLSVYTPAGASLAVRGELSELSYADSIYTLKILTSKVKGGVLRLLESYTSSGADMGMAAKGSLDVNTSVVLDSWSMKYEAPHMYSLEIKFRSDNAIF